MRNIRFNNWKVKGNELSISLTRFNVKIKVERDCEKLYYLVEVIDDDAKKLLLNIYTLEDAIYFVESVIQACKDNEQVLDEYLDWFNKMYGDEKKEEGIVTLSPYEINQAITEYFSYGKDYRVSVENEFDFTDNMITMNYYLIEHFDNEKIRTKLTNFDLIDSFDFFLEDLDYDVEQFDYLIDITDNGPIYKGVNLRVNKLDRMIPTFNN